MLTLPIPGHQQKLVQLNKKYDFLSTARCVIDLCAAPGGWLQVAAKNMPQNSIILGVDLVAIKPIPRCITLVEDITTESCRRALRNEMKDWKADVVLHDGAPNVGSAWVQDAFTQVELVLSSLKLATDFLTPGGTFVTKVFRSKDYNSLLWVFNQLFRKVEATKPPSSRNVSAEIFVVCTGYLAPQKIDPKLLSAKHVFSDLTEVTADPLSTTRNTDKDVLTPSTLNVFHPEKKRRNRDGYDDGDLLLYKECGMMQFVRSADPIGVLAAMGRIRWVEDEDKKLLKHPLTTEDIKASVEDLKVLGKKDFKNLLKYRLGLREDLGIDVKVKEVDDETDKVEVEPLDEEEQIQEELDRLAGEDAHRRRRDRRKVNERKTREVQRMQLNMITPMDIGLERQDGVDMSDMFDLGEEEKVHGMGINEGDLSGEDSDSDGEGPRRRRLQDVEEEDEVDENGDELDDEEKKARRLEGALDQLYEGFHAQKLERDLKHKAKEAKKKRDAAQGGEWGGIGAGEESESEDEVDDDPAPAPETDDDSTDDEAIGGMAVDGNDSDVEAEGAENAAPVVSKRAQKAAELKAAREKQKAAKLLTTLPKAGKVAPSKSKQAAMWFDQPVFKGLPGLENMLSGDVEDDEDREWQELDEEEARAEAEALAAYAEREGADDEEEDVEDEEVEEDDDESDDDFEGARETHFEDSDMEEEADFKAQEEAEELKRQRIEELGLTTAEAMTLAQQLVNRERTKTQLIDEGFNRHTANVGGDDLPSWFTDDEHKHFRNNIPVTKEAVAALREKMRALNARPIKKIAEAKARKKMRTIRRIEKTRAKAQGINDDEDNGLTEKEKAASIAKVLAKTSNAKPVKKEVSLVVARGLNRGQKGRPKGVKGRYKMVDPRMKKELKKMKEIKKRDRVGGGRRKKNH